MSFFKNEKLGKVWSENTLECIVIIGLNRIKNQLKHFFVTRFLLRISEVFSEYALRDSLRDFWFIVTAPGIYLGISKEAVLHGCSYKKMLWKYAANLQECHFNKVANQLYWNHTLAWPFSCKFAAYFQNLCFLRTPLEGMCNGNLKNNFDKFASVEFPWKTSHILRNESTIASP